MKVTKTIERWGLMCRPANEHGKWHFVSRAACFFDTELEAYKRANIWNTEKPSPSYLYRPMRFFIDVPHTPDA
jgi:hypothetical protein